MTENVEANPLSSQPAKTASEHVSRLIDGTSDTQTVESLKEIRSKIRTIDRNRRAAADRLDDLHQAAGSVLQGMRDDDGKCFFCGNLQVQHADWCIAWPLIAWRDGNHKTGNTQTSRHAFGAKNRGANAAAAGTLENESWDDAPPGSG